MSLPRWLQQAVDEIKKASGVEFLPGRLVPTLREQVLGASRGAQLSDEDVLPSRVHDAMLNCRALNDSLEARGLNRQSVFTLVESGAWLAAPARRPERGRVTETKESPEQKLERLEREGQERMHMRDQADRERWQRDRPDLPFEEWRERNSRRFAMWIEYRKVFPSVPPFPVPPLTADGSGLDIKFRPPVQSTPMSALGALADSWVAAEEPGQAEVSEDLLLC